MIVPILAALILIAIAWRETLPERDRKAFTACVILILLALAVWFLPEFTSVSPAGVIIRFFEGRFGLPIHAD